MFMGEYVLSTWYVEIFMLGEQVNFMTSRYATAVTLYMIWKSLHILFLWIDELEQTIYK
jgi:hypothetical protein